VLLEQAMAAVLVSFAGDVPITTEVEAGIVTVWPFAMIAVSPFEGIAAGVQVAGSFQLPVVAEV
jgi:hypothetical protein